MIPYSVFWNIAKNFDPEFVHDYTLSLLRQFPQIAKLFTPLHTEPTKGFNITWPNPLGIAAGLDKNAACLDFWNAFGVGCIEVGTVTPLPQYGNPKPRIFRHSQNSLINSMGFPSLGSEIVYNRVLKFKIKNANNENKSKIWINIGKQKDTPLDSALNDYTKLITRFSDVADAISVNISSPNTQDLRLLQNQEYLPDFLKSLANHRDLQKKNVPLFLKISPDESSDFYLTLPKLLKIHHWQGVIATNTTKNHSESNGGLSGQKLFDLSYEVAKKMSTHCSELNLDYIFVGGLNHHDQYLKLKELNIKFFQFYTGLIYQGPMVLHRFLNTK